MLDRTEPTLADGTPIANMVMDTTKEVSMRALADPEIYKLELERIFTKTWICLGHDSELPEAGDYVVRNMGGDQVIVARAADGEIHVSLNICPHRGMRICSAEAGKAMIHRCVYHGWAFRPDGSFVGAPVERERMHGDIFSKRELGLDKARVSLYGGLIFATWNHEGPSLDDHLGDMKWYFDVLFNRSDRGLEVLQPPHRLLIPANWKSIGEQSANDGFHTLTLHRSIMELGQMGVTTESIYDAAPGMYGIDIGHPKGHTARCIPAEHTFQNAQDMHVSEMSVQDRIRVLPPPGISPDMLPELDRHLDEGQIRLLAEHPPLTGSIFPTCFFLFLYVPMPDGTMSSTIILHNFTPISIDQVEFQTWFLAEKDASPEMKRQMLANGIRWFGSSGILDQDDAETWPNMTRSAKGPRGAAGTLKYQALTGHHKPDGWPGGALVYPGFSKDDTQWNWWLSWRDMMTAVG
jgi:phenylpropionate dioxygenase-like ring-hydroxylating dioxygenase large terminal subunit